MKKIFFTVLTLLVVAAMLVACGEDNNMTSPSAVPPSVAPSEPVDGSKAPTGTDQPDTSAAPSESPAALPSTSVLPSISIEPDTSQTPNSSAK